MSYPTAHLNIPASLPTSIYGAAWRALRLDPGKSALFVLSAAVHALAHGALAWCAALLARQLASQPGNFASDSTISPAWLALLGLGAATLKAVSGTLAVLAQSRTAAACGEALRDGAIQRVLENGLRSSTTASIARLATRIREVERAVHEGALASVRAVAQLVPIALALWYLSRPLTLAAVLVLGAFGLLLARLRSKLKRSHQHAMTVADELHGEVDDLVRHADLWRTYGTGRHIRAVLGALAHRAGLAQSRSEVLRVALSSSNEVLAAMALLGAIAAAGAWPWLAPTDLIAFAAVFFLAYRPLRDLGDARSSVLRGEEALEALGEVAREAPLSRSSQPKEPSGAAGVLEVAGLGLPGRTPLVSFALEPGQTLAMLGPTGAGKTSILRCLLGLEPDAVGQVTMAGRPLAAGCVGPSARPFAWVPQEAPVISGTLHDNFALAGVNLVDGSAELSALGASELTDGISNVKLGAGGRPLSGGERRWLSLARALATREPVLLLDEPTAGLDPSARETVLRTLQALHGRRSVVLVTHDLGLAACAHQVITLDRHAPASAASPGPLTVAQAQKPQSANLTSVR
jgi:ABC-type transport system involved in cytochrome bd biosynthesis fused ATPase/permease subunit